MKSVIISFSNLFQKFFALKKIHQKLLTLEATFLHCFSYLVLIFCINISILAHSDYGATKSKAVAAEAMSISFNSISLNLAPRHESDTLFPAKRTLKLSPEHHIKVRE